MSLACNGFFPVVYYLASVGWPLDAEVSPDTLAQQDVLQPDWMRVPEKAEALESVQAYCSLRHSHPFSLRHLCRAAARKALKEQVKVARGGRETEILTSIMGLRFPGVLRMYLAFLDSDYSDAERCWWQLGGRLTPPRARKGVRGELEVEEDASSSVT